MSSINVILQFLHQPLTQGIHLLPSKIAPWLFLDEFCLVHSIVCHLCIPQPVLMSPQCYTLIHFRVNSTPVFPGSGRFSGHGTFSAKARKGPGKMGQVDNPEFILAHCSCHWGWGLPYWRGILTAFSVITTADALLAILLIAYHHLPRSFFPASISLSWFWQHVYIVCSLRKSGVSSSFSPGVYQPCGCLQRAKCNFNTLIVQE